MVNKKCENCKKNITKKSSGLECSRCEKVFHADSVCSKLTKKQLSAVQYSPGIEWSCEECLKNVTRRSSYMIPEDDDDDESGSEFHINSQTLDTRKLVQDISRELKKTFREEISHLETSLDFVSDQIRSMEQSISRQDNIIKELERKNLDFQHKNKNLELRVSVLEQEMCTIEQKALESSLEVAGLPSVLSPREIEPLLSSIAVKLNMEVRDVEKTQRLPGPKEKPTTLRVEMKSNSIRDQWIEASKKKCLTLGALLPNVPKEKVEDRVYIRQALTKNLKTILYNTKLNLSKSFQFIWCKHGKVCVRKTGDSKIYYIYSVEDIKELQKQNTKSSEL